MNLRDSYAVVRWDISKKNLDVRTWGKQNDTGRGLRITMIQNSVEVTPTTETIRFYCEKKDGTRVYIDATVVGKEFIVDFTNQVFAVKGNALGELQLSVGGKWVASETFKIPVDESLVDGSIVSTDEFTALQTALNKVDNLEEEYAPRLNTVETQLADIPNQTYITEKAKQTDLAALQTQVTSVASGSPKGTYATVSALTTAYPSGNSNIYVVTADGGWYYWSGSAWTNGGAYQSTGIADKSISASKINDNLFNGLYYDEIMSQWELGSFSADGQPVNATNRLRSKYFIKANKGDFVKNLNTAGFKFGVNIYSLSTKTWQEVIGWITVGDTVEILQDCYIKITYAYTDDRVITDVAVANCKVMRVGTPHNHYDLALLNSLSENDGILFFKGEQVGENFEAQTNNYKVLDLNGLNFTNSPNTLILNDLSGANNNAMVENFSFTTSSGSDELGGIKFDGINDYIRVADNPSLDLTNKMTIKVKFKLSTLEGIQDIINKTLSSGYSLEYNLSSDNKIGFYCHINGAYRSAKSDYPLEVDKEYEIVGRYDGSKVELFVDGIKQNTSTPVVGNILTNQQDLRLGSSSTGNLMFSGTLYYVKIYNEALSDEAISYKSQTTEQVFDKNKNNYLDSILDYVSDVESIRQIAHRGYSTSAPENTIPAFVLAKRKGFKYVEGDVLWTADNVPVMLHDGTIDRTSDGTGNVLTFTYEQLLAYDFGSWFGAEFTGTRIPTFREFILVCKKLNLHPYIEIKKAINTIQAGILVDIVKKLGMVKNVTWISFSKTSLLNIKALLPNANFALALLGNTIQDGIDLLSGGNEVSLTVEHTTLTIELAESILISGLGIIAWTVNDYAALNVLADKGVTEIFTDTLQIKKYFHENI